jgi:hypothetical protein
VGLCGGFSVSASVAGESTLTFAEAWQQVRTVNPALEAARVETARAVSTAEYVVVLANLLEARGQPDRFINYEARATERILP